MATHNAARTAYDLLHDKEVISRLGLRPVEASQMGLALVADAILAPKLAARLLAKHVAGIEEIERRETYATEEPVFEGTDPYPVLRTN